MLSIISYLFLQSDGAASPASSHSSQFDEMIAARRRRMAQDEQVISGLANRQRLVKKSATAVGSISNGVQSANLT